MLQANNTRNLNNMFVLEGSDAVGKSTVCKLLKEKFISEGKDAVIIKFPNYESVTSKIIVDYLHNDMDIHVEDELYRAKTIANIYAIDRAITLNSSYNGKRSLYEEMLSKPDTIFIVDRYTQSNIIHQTHSLSEDDIYEFGKWLFDLEFNSLQLPVPNTSFYLVPNTVDIIFRNINNRGEERDVLETDDRISKSYLALTETPAVIELLYQSFPCKRKVKVGITFDDTAEQVAQYVYENIVRIMNDTF